MKNLYIAEKPSVAMEFAKAIGMSGGKKDGYLEDDDNIVTWCVGHLVTMSYPDKYDPELKKWDMAALPFLPEPEKYKYEVIDNVKKQYNVVAKLLNRKDVGTIFYAGDSAREGEYIQRLVRQHAGHNANATERRIWIDSQTKEEILKGIRNAKPLSDYDLLSDSAYARAIEDYAIGINFSRAMSLRYRDMIFAAAGKQSGTIAIGRVMTCVLGMVVNRERQIRDGIRTPYHTVYAQIGSIQAQWTAKDGSQYYQPEDLYRNKQVSGFLDKTKAAAFTAMLGDRITFSGLAETSQNKAAPLLFNLAELQGECTKLFKIGPDQTLEIAQKLYESKLTTYPRTDARVLTTAVCKEITINITGLQSVPEISGYAADIITNKKYAGIENTKYTNDAAVSDHYAIIPTGQTDTIGTLSELERNVYLLIARRFLSIFMPPAVYNKAKGTFIRNGETFETTASDLISAGWLEVAQKIPETSQARALIGAMRTMQAGIDYQASYSSKEELTSLPPRYTTGSMILAMENAGRLIEDEELREQIKGSGIGTSATRAECIKKLNKNGYIKIDSKTQVIKPDKLGELIYEAVALAAPGLLKPDLTANWEKGLSQIADGTITKDKYYGILYDFVIKIVKSIQAKDLTPQLKDRITALKAVYKDLSDAPVQGKSGGPSGIPCPICGRDLNRIGGGPKQGSYGCSGYKTGDCNFFLGNTFCGKNLTPAQMQQLLIGKTTAKIKGFKSKAGKSFDAKLKLGEDGRIQFVFS